MGFSEYNGDMMGLAVNEQYRVYKWSQDTCKILFSVTRLGRGAFCHFASDKAGLKYLKQALNEFTTYVFQNYSWCKMIIANVKKPSTVRFLSRLGFKPILYQDNHTIMVRRF